MPDAHDDVLCFETAKGQPQIIGRHDRARQGHRIARRFHAQRQHHAEQAVACHEDSGSTQQGSDGRERFAHVLDHGINPPSAVSSKVGTF